MSRSIPKMPLLLAAASMPFTVALAPTAGAQQATLEEIVVTARRYEESITDAPLAVAVMNDDYVREQGISNIQDIIELTPGAMWNEFTRAQPTMSMRGIEGGNFGNSSLESAVQVVVDGVAQTKAFMMSPPVYDLERVEVMRGPQGTTFGRNATLGLMHFVTARPTQEFESGVDLSAGSLDLFGVDAFASGGLTDTVSGRVAFHFRETDGAMEDADTGDPLEGYENTSIRGSLLFEPSDDFSAYIKAEFNQDDDGAVVRLGPRKDGNPFLTSPPYINEYIEPLDQWKTKISPPPPGGFRTERDMFFLTAELVWALGDDITLTSLTGYQDGDHDTVQDVFGSPEVIQDQYVRNEGEVLSTELRIDNSASGDSFRWLGGIYLLQDEEYRFEDNNQFPERGMGGGRITPQAESHNQQNGDASTSSLGIFGELSFDLTDQLNLTVGGRFSDDSRDYTFWVDAWGRTGTLGGIGAVIDGLGDPARDCGNPLNQSIDPATGGTVCGSAANPMGFDPVALSNDWDNFSAKLSLSYAINDNNNVYFLYSEGFKAGGFQHDARNIASVVNNVIDSEEAENFEIGWKGAYDRANFAVTVFNIEQTNAQNNALIPVGAGFTTLVANFGGVENTGIELEGTFLVGDNFTVGGNIALYDAELGPGSVIGGMSDGSGNIVGEDVSGGRPNNSPEETYVLWGEYVWGLSGGANIAFRADIQHRGDAWGRLPNREALATDGTLLFLKPEIDNIGANITWTSADGGTSVSLWGRNLSDDLDYDTFGPPIGFHFAPSSTPGIALAPTGYSGRKQFGVDARFRF